MVSKKFLSLKYRTWDYKDQLFLPFRGNPTKFDLFKVQGHDSFVTEVLH